MALLSKKFRGTRLKNSAIFCAAATLLVSSAAPAQAYYYGNYGLGNLLWPVRALIYPLAATPWSYRSPAYMASTTIQAAARSSYRVMPQSNVYGSSLNYTEDQVAANGNANLLKVPQGPADQISYARWTKPTDLADRELLSRAPGAQSLPVVQDEEVKGQVEMPQGGSNQSFAPLGYPVTYGGQSGFNANNPNYGQQAPMPAPPLTKQKKSKSQSSSKQSDSGGFQQQQVAQQSNQFSQSNQFNQLIPQNLSSPLAAHFIETVNGRFDGDIGKALKHSETRNLAEAMGLVDRKNFSVSGLGQDRIETISRIFRDQSLDPASKLDAMKILLRSSGGSGQSMAHTEDRSF